MQERKDLQVKPNPHECVEWLRKYRAWKANPNAPQPPEKPAGFDLWLQGNDPLGLGKVSVISCPGGGLISKSWTQSAKP